MNNTDKILEKIESMGCTLPEVPAPIGSYLNCVRTGNQLHLSGGLPFVPDDKVQGTVPTETSVETAQHGAKLIVLNRLAVAKAELGSLDKIKQVVSISGFVNSASDFYDHPLVINAASDMLVEIFGDAGRHSRIAVGVSALPLNASVEISMILEIQD